MNTIDLLDKLNLPIKLGLEGDDALNSQKTIMEAIISAASLQMNHLLYNTEMVRTTPPLNRASSGEVTLNQLSQDIVKHSQSFDLFKVFCDDVSAVSEDFTSGETKIVVDLYKLQESSLDTASEGDHRVHCFGKAITEKVETEYDIYSKVEPEKMRKTRKNVTSTNKKSAKGNVNEFIAEERRRLIKKLTSCEGDKIIFQRRAKSNQKDPKVTADNYRGSKFWGVSKNKSKWQVMITLNHFKEYKGGFEDELSAARFYDKKSICTFGLKAKTNFNYTKNEVLALLREDEIIVM
jgi:hypothetical protein